MSPQLFRRHRCRMLCQSVVTEWGGTWWYQNEGFVPSGFCRFSPKRLRVEGMAKLGLTMGKQPSLDSPATPELRRSFGGSGVFSRPREAHRQRCLRRHMASEYSGNWRRTSTRMIPGVVSSLLHQSFLSASKIFFEKLVSSSFFQTACGLFCHLQARRL